MITVATVDDLAYVAESSGDILAMSATLPKAFSAEKFIASWTYLITSGIGVMFLERDEKGRIMGALAACHYPDINNGQETSTELFWFVKPEHRGSGMGLYRAFETWSVGMGCVQIRMGLLVDSMPKKLDRIYKRLGFKQCEIHYSKDLPCVA